MPYTIPDLCSSRNLSEAEVKQILVASKLSLEQKEYRDEDIRDKFDPVWRLVADGQARNYEEAGELFAVQTLAKSKNRLSKNDTGANKSTKTQKDTPNSTPQPPLIDKNRLAMGEANLSILDLINQAKELLGLTLTLKQVVAMLEAAGLEDKPFYTQAEGNGFLITCRLLVQGENNNLNSRIQDAAITLETGLIDLIRGVTNERAKEVPQVVKQLYLQNVVLALAENQEDLETFFMQLKNGIIAGIEGKSPLRSILEAQWITLPLPESESLPHRSLATSETGTNIDITSESKPSDKP